MDMKDNTVEKTVLSTIDENHESKNWNNNGNVNLYINDTASVFSGASGYTGIISSVGAEYQSSDTLVAMIGVGEYNGLPNLDGVIKDYENVIKTFSTHWKYNILFQLANNRCIYTSDIKALKLEANQDYKLKWNSSEIDTFVELTRKHIIQENHDGLIFIISSHGDSGKVMYDSNCEQYELEYLFAMYRPAASALLESYHEAQEESNYLSQIPKVFVLDMCRGGIAAKPVKTRKLITEKKQEQEKEKRKKKENQTDEELKTDKLVCSKQNSDGNLTTTAPISKQHDNTKSKNNASNEKMTLKSVTKEDAQLFATEVSNFCMIYGTAEGFVSSDGSEKGGLFLRNFCKVFSDKKFVSNHYLNDIILKIREYTKREATILSDALPFTQMVETEGTLEKNVRFCIKMAHFGFGMFDYDNLNNNEEIPRKLLITNLSPSHEIAALVEYEYTTEDRQEMLNNLAHCTRNDSKESLFKTYKFKMIEAGGGMHEFKKPIFDRVFITLFVIDENNGTAGAINSNDEMKSKKNSENEHSDDELHRERYDRLESKDDYLYFENDRLTRMYDLPLKCSKSKKHHLVQTPISGNVSCHNCGSIDVHMYYTHSFVCRMCGYYVCPKCCHDMVLSNHIKRKNNSANGTKNIEAINKQRKKVGELRLSYSNKKMLTSCL